MGVADAAAGGVVSVGTTRVSRSPSLLLLPQHAVVAFVMLFNTGAGVVVSVAMGAILSLVVQA